MIRLCCSSHPQAVVKTWSTHLSGWFVYLLLQTEPFASPLYWACHAMRGLNRHPSSWTFKHLCRKLIQFGIILWVKFKVGDFVSTAGRWLKLWLFLKTSTSWEGPHNLKQYFYFFGISFFGNLCSRSRVRLPDMANSFFEIIDHDVASILAPLVEVRSRRIAHFISQAWNYDSFCLAFSPIVCCRNFLSLAPPISLLPFGLQ